MKLNYYVGDKLLHVEIFAACPGCGDIKNLAMHRRVISYAKNKWKYRVGCNICNWEGPEANDAKQAANLWDARSLTLIFQGELKTFRSENNAK